eukprot:764847-Hanusia_phi.AAC.2
MPSAGWGTRVQLRCRFAGLASTVVAGTKLTGCREWRRETGLTSTEAHQLQPSFEIKSPGSLVECDQQKLDKFAVLTWSPGAGSDE